MTELGDILGVSHPTISQWMSQRSGITEFHARAIERVAEAVRRGIRNHGALKIEAQNEVKIREIKETTKTDLRLVDYDFREIKPLRVYRSLSAGRGNWNNETNIEDVRLAVREMKPNHIAVYVSGDSMSPTIIDGDIAIVDTTMDWKREGNIVAAVVEGKTLIKRIALIRPRVVLISDNPSHGQVRCNQGDVIGVVIEVVRKFSP